MTDTQTRILDVAQDLIQQRGLNAMSFQDLSDAVGIRKASVHHHFANKAVMVHALLDRYMGTFDAAVDEILDAPVLGRTQLRRYFDLFLDTGRDGKSCLCGMLIAEMDSLDPQGVSRVQQFMRSNFEHIRKMIRTGVEDGSLSKRGDASGTAEMVLATLEGALILSRCDGGAERLANTLTRLMSLLSTP